MRGKFGLIICLFAFIAALSLTGCGAKENNSAVSKSIEPGKEAGEVKINPIDGAEMVWVPAGEFLMGSTEEEISELMKDFGIPEESWWEFEAETPQRKVDLDGFWMYKNLVTVAQFKEFCEQTGRKMPDEPVWGWQDDHPMVNVSWLDAVAYAEWAGVRLPTEAQWEKAARGMDGRQYPWGNEWDPDKSNNGETGPGQTTQVGSYPSGASPYGCLDMAGNVWEWCSDWYDPFYYKDAPNKNPQGPESPVIVENDEGQTREGPRVSRGGSWFYEFFVLSHRCSFRGKNFSDNSKDSLGFRCAVTP